jgi:Protein of unknown function (DUF2795)
VTRRTELPTAGAVEQALLDADFPASKEQLISVAEQAAAGDAVLSALRSLPVADYANRGEVVRSVETIEATGQTPSQKGAQAREQRPPGVAEHRRTAGT